jgi:uncharacterized C2H2 Zn-finger protein
MSPRKRSAASEKSGTLVCPECGRTFTRPASLGAHRNRAHGIAGSSKAKARAGRKTATRGRKTAASRPSATTTTRARSKTAASRRKTVTSTQPVSATSTQRASRTGSARSVPARRARRTPLERQDRGVNRDSLLQSLFPTGIPAREDALRRVNAWLDEAERLARMR